MGPLPLTLNFKLENHDSEHYFIVLGIYFTPVDLFLCMFNSLSLWHLFRNIQFVSKQVSRSVALVDWFNLKPMLADMGPKSHC